MPVSEDEKELIKAGTEAAFKPFAELINKLFGGVADQVGGTWEDRLKFRREVNRLKLIKKLYTTIQTLGIEPRSIADSVWIPAFEAVSLTDEDALQARWSNLLANAADPIGPPVLAIFTSFLRDLGSREVVFLDGLWGDALSRATNHPLFKTPSKMIYTLEELQDLYVAFGLAKVRRLHSVESAETNNPNLPIDTENFWMMLDIIQRHNIIRDATVEERHVRGQVSTGHRDLIVRRYHFSDLGFAFFKACRPPARR